MNQSIYCVKPGSRRLKGTTVVGIWPPQWRFSSELEHQFKAQGNLSRTAIPKNGVA